MKHKKLNRTLLGAMLMTGALGVASQAHADLNLSPLNATYNVASTNNLGQTDMETLTGVSPLGLVYKQDYGGLESGNGANYYTTTFSPDLVSGVSGDASGATITWDGPLNISCPSCFLVVKDGNHTYPNYVFDISGWDGKAPINLSGFWEGPGAISNIAIWNNAEPGGGGGGSLVPEPETYAMLLAGLGLVGFAARRKLG